MPKKKKEESQRKQSKRFIETVQDMINAGELNPTEAEDEFERVMQKIVPVANRSKAD